MKLSRREHLTPEEAEAAAETLADPEVPDAEKRDFLLSLTEKGETPEEIAGFAKVFLRHARSPGEGVLELARDGIDFVGTGGDHSGAYNISTTVSFVLATAGVNVIKHGNRGATSKSGSADLLEALGVPLEADNSQLEAALRETHFCFLFARAFHPVFKHIVPVRVQLAQEGKRTIFNLLGPLLNPAQPRRQVLGVFSEYLVEPMAAALDVLGVERGLVVHGKMLPDGVVDKLSSAGPSHIRGVGELEDLVTHYNPEDLGLSLAPAADLRGGDAAENLELLERFLVGKAPTGLAETLYLNAGAGLYVMRKADSLKEGIALARDLVSTGAVARWIDATRAFYRELGTA